MPVRWIANKKEKKWHLIYWLKQTFLESVKKIQLSHPLSRYNIFNIDFLLNSRSSCRCKCSKNKCQTLEGQLYLFRLYKHSMSFVFTCHSNLWLIGESYSWKKQKKNKLGWQNVPPFVISVLSPLHCHCKGDNWIIDISQIVYQDRWKDRHYKNTV